MPLPRDRLVGDTAALVLLACAMAVIGMFFAPMLGLALMRSARIGNLAFSNPGDMEFPGLAYAFALPAAVAWVVGLVDRYRGRGVPSGKRLAAYFAIALVVMIAGVFASVQLNARALREVASSIVPIVTPESFQLPFVALKANALAALVLAALPIRRRDAA